MSSSELDVGGSWVPRACTLPTADQPLRLAEFDQLFAEGVLGAERPSATRLALALKPTAELAARAADLAVRETACCSFFTFRLTATRDALDLEVAVPDGHVDVLDGLAAQVGEVRR